MRSSVQPVPPLADLPPGARLDRRRGRRRHCVPARRNRTWRLARKRFSSAQGWGEGTAQRRFQHAAHRPGPLCRRSCCATHAPCAASAEPRSMLRAEPNSRPARSKCSAAAARFPRERSICPSIPCILPRLTWTCTSLGSRVPRAPPQSHPPGAAVPRADARASSRLRSWAKPRCRSATMGPGALCQRSVALSFCPQ